MIIRTQVSSSTYELMTSNRWFLLLLFLLLLANRSNQLLSSRKTKQAAKPQKLCRRSAVSLGISGEKLWSLLSGTEGNRAAEMINAARELFVSEAWACIRDCSSGYILWLAKASASSVKGPPGRKTGGSHCSTTIRSLTRLTQPIKTCTIVQMGNWMELPKHGIMEAAAWLPWQR